MKKSTIIIIFIIYVASIILIGFFGMRVKAYDLQKYVKAIEMSAEAEDKAMFKLESLGKTENKDNHYKLTVYYDKGKTGDFEIDGIIETRKYVPLTLIPKITYTSGELGKGEKIKYTISREELIDNHSIELTEYGVLTCFRKTSFIIYVAPASSSGIGSSAIIDVFVI